MSFSALTYGIRDAKTAAMVDDLVARADLAMAEYLNAAAEQIKEDSQLTVPKSEEHRARLDPGYPDIPLEENVEVIEATPEKLYAAVVYGGPYAAAQEAGVMTYISRGGKEVEWVAENYTTPGTGPHFLENAGKTVTTQGEAELAAVARTIMEVP